MTCAPRVCGCRGARACLLCQGSTGEPKSLDESAGPSLYQCHNCGRVGWLGDLPEDVRIPPLHACRDPCSHATVLHSSSSPRALGTHTPLDGVTIVKEFISRQEERAIVSAIDSNTWVDSQSGRRKQVSVHLHPMQPLYYADLIYRTMARR